MEERRGGCRRFFVIGCGLMLLLLIAGGVTTYFKWRDWTAYLVKQGIDELLKASTLSGEEKMGLTHSTNRLLDEFKAGRFSGKQFETLFAKLDKAHFYRILMMRSVKEGIAQNKNLTAEEKGQAAAKIDNLLKCLRAGVVSDAEFNRAAKLFESEADDGFDGDAGGGGVNVRVGHQTGMRANMSAEEIKDAMLIIDRILENKTIPDGPFVYEAHKEFDAILNEVFGK